LTTKRHYLQIIIHHWCISRSRSPILILTYLIELDITVYYQSNLNLLFDDLRANSIEFNYLLTLLERGAAMPVKVFGSIALWDPEVIYITSPFAPTALFKDRWDPITRTTVPNGQIAQLTCRITETRCMRGQNRRIEMDEVAPPTIDVQGPVGAPQPDWDFMDRV